jgi:hypothetical protein
VKLLNDDEELISRGLKFEKLEDCSGYKYARRVEA